MPFQVLAASIDETVAAGEAPEAYVARVAADKARAGWRLSQETATAESGPAPVLAADTVVVLDRKILLKPAHRADGERMLLDLSARTHEVLTCVALALPTGLECRLSRSEVTFRTIRGPEATRYWDTGEPHDKAGAYAIQGYGAVFVVHLSGSYSGVMGLPLHETAELLSQAGVPRWT